MGLDDSLLAKNNQELGGEEDFSDEQAAQETVSPGAVSTPAQPQSLREAVRMDKAKKEATEKKAVSVEKPNPIRMQMSSLLRSAWMNLISSFGLTLLWIDAHVFLRLILGKSMFCKLGEEWTDRPGVQVKPSSEGKEVKMLTMTEPMGVACCNFGCLLVVLLILVIVSMLVGAVDVLVDMAVGWVKGLFSWK